MDRRPRQALEAPNFFMADIQTGIGGTLGGWVAEHMGYPTAFVLLGALSLGSIAISMGGPARAIQSTR